MLWQKIKIVSLLSREKGERLLIRLLPVFLVIPFLELYLLLVLGQKLGALSTFSLIILTGVVGWYFAQAQGWATWQKLQLALSRGQVPGNELLEGFVILFGAILLITPGILTDICGLLCLIPFIRLQICQWLKVKIKVWLENGNFYIFYH